MNAETQSRLTRIILISLAGLAPAYWPMGKYVDADTVALSLMVAALIFPPLFQWRFSPDRLSYWDSLQIVAQLIGPAPLAFGAEYFGIHGFYTFLAILFYGAMILSVLLGDILGIVRQLRK